MVRMDNVTGRTDDLLIVRGVNLYPSEIEHAVLDINGVAPSSVSTSAPGSRVGTRRAGERQGRQEVGRDHRHRLRTRRAPRQPRLAVDRVGKIQRVYDHRN